MAKCITKRSMPNPTIRCAMYDACDAFISFNVHVRQQVSAAAHFFQFKVVHDLSFRRFVNVFLGQINDLFGVHAARHLQSPHFAEIVFVLVSDDVAAGEALDRDDHCFL